MRPNRRVVALGVLALVTGRAAGGRVGPWESSVFRFFNQRSDALHGPIWIVMQAGSLGAVWAAAAVVWARQERYEATRLAFLGTAVWAGVKLVKPTVGRGRPAAMLEGVRVRGHEQTGLGFPSGHAAVATTLALLVPWSDPVHRRRAVGGAVIVGLARMYVGAHLPLDVVGGLVAGTVIVDAACGHSTGSRGL